MATVRQSGGDYSTLNAALAASEATITIDEAWTADDSTAATVLADTTITVSGGALHNGFYLESDNHYRLQVTSGTALTLSGAFTATIDGIAIDQAGTVSSAEAFRCVPGTSDSVTIKNSILVVTGDTGSQDCIYIGFNTAIGTIELENCCLHGAYRAAIESQNNHSSSGNGAALKINSCTILNNGRDPSPANQAAVGGGISLTKDSGSASTGFDIDIHNTICMENDTGGTSTTSPQDFHDNRKSGQAEPFNTWDVSYSIDSDASIASDTGGGTGNLASRVAAEIDQGAGSFVLFEDITSGTEDLRLTDFGNAKNNAQEMHAVDTAHGLTIPSTDIVGTTRQQGTNHDCGPFEIVVAAAGAGLPRNPFSNFQPNLMR